MPARPPRNSALIIAVAIVIAALLAPVAAVAAGQLVEISSPSGRKADVTRAEQLQTAEASPHQFVRGWGIIGGDGICRQVLTAPATKAVVIKTVVIDVSSVPGPGGAVWLAVGPPADRCLYPITSMSVDAIGPIVFNLEPGVAVPAGGRLTMQATVLAGAYAFGYKVADTAVPATVADAPGPARPAD